MRYLNPLGARVPEAGYIGVKTSDLTISAQLLGPKSLIIGYLDPLGKV